MRERERERERGKGDTIRQYINANKVTCKDTDASLAFQDEFLGVVNQLTFVTL